MEHHQVTGSIKHVPQISSFSFPALTHPVPTLTLILNSVSIIHHFSLEVYCLWVKSSLVLLGFGLWVNEMMYKYELILSEIDLWVYLGWFIFIDDCYSILWQHQHLSIWSTHLDCSGYTCAKETLKYICRRGITPS